MSGKESSSSSSSSQSSPASSPEIPKKDLHSPKSPSQLPKSPESPPDIPKKAPQSQETPPEIPKKAAKSQETPPEIPKKTKESRSPPEIPKKAAKSQETPPEIPKKTKESRSPPEIPPKELQSQETPPEIPKKTKESQSPPEIPKKALQSQETPPEIPKKALQSQETPPEIPKKTNEPQSPTEPFKSPPEILKQEPHSQNAETPKKDPASSPKITEKTTSSPKVPEKNTSSPSASPTVSKASESPGTTEKQNVSSPESSKDEPKSQKGDSEVFSKKSRYNKSFKSSLQVFLQQKHDKELQKTIDYKTKLEKGEETDEDDKEEESKETRRASEDNGVDKTRRGEENEGIKNSNMKRVDKSAKEENTCAKATKNKKEESDANQTKEVKAKTKENGKMDKEREKEKKVKKAKKEKERSPEIMTQKTQEEEITKEEKKEVTEEERKIKTTEEETAGEEEKKTKKREQARSTRKKEGMKDERPQGHLYLKKKRTFNPWKEYYFVLDGLLLTYYRSQHDYERLSSMKGSLDLSLVEEVRTKKPGLMRTHHPLCLARRNLPSIKLAAETKQEQERWLEVLKTAVGPSRLSCYSSERNLNSGASPTAQLAKSATLPSRTKDLSTYSSSITEEEEEEEKKVKEEEKKVKEEEKKVKEEEEKEEPELIKPKKILRIPVGMPMFKPNLDQMKLKNVEKEVKREDAEEGKATNVSLSPNSPRESHRQEHTSKEASVSEVFGVVLKKAKIKEKEEKEEEKEEEEKEEKEEEEEEEKEEEEKEVGKQEVEKESFKEAGSRRDGSASPGHASSSNRRHLKQPVIPLNNKKLLVLPEVKESKSPKVSPAVQKRSTVERRKSPSPSLPISKSVQALTKSAEEVKPTQVDTISSADTATTIEWKGKDGEVKVCHAYSSEMKYSEEVDLLDMEEVTEKVIKERSDGADEGVKEKNETPENEYKTMNEVEKNEISENEHRVMNENEKQKQKEKEGAMILLDTAFKVDENEKEQEEESNKEIVTRFKEEALSENTFSEESLDNYHIDSQQEEGKKKHKDEALSTECKSKGPELFHSDNLPESSSVVTPLTPPASPASSVTSTDSEPVPKAASSSTSSSELVLPPQSDLLSHEQTTSSDDRRDVEERVHSTTQDNKQRANEKQEEEFEIVPCDGPRDRSNTNESTASSSCLEGAEKKPSKLKLFKNKLKGGSMKEKKEESAVQKEPKEKKRRGSNTFSSLLQGKKTKEGNRKAAEEEPQPSQVEETDRSRVVSPEEMIHPSEAPIPAKELPVTVKPAVEVQVIPPSALQSYEEELQEKQDTLLSSHGSAGDGMVTLRATATYSETRSSVQSRTSCGSRDDPPPSIPEKKYMRAPSPNHDVPKSNRPVTNLQLMTTEGEDDDELETTQQVDGYITQEQIEALLHAKENREKRKQSFSRNQPFAKPDIVKDMSATSLTSDEWPAKRPSYISCSSIDSDEPLLTTHFLSFEQQSSSSSSIKGPSKAEASEHPSCSFSESGDSHSPDVEGPADPLRRAPRATDGITAKNRISLTSQKFTVEEEELLGSPETPKVRPTRDINAGEDRADEEEHVSSEDESEAKAECKDFFPVVGGDVQLRREPASLDLPTGDLRTSGIVRLKEYLEAQEEKEDFQDVKSGISRLGHSAAIEKLKQTPIEQ